jgi:hypothetical protein
MIKRQDLRIHVAKERVEAQSKGGTRKGKPIQ